MLLFNPFLLSLQCLPPPPFCGVELNIESSTCPHQTDDLALNYINSPKTLFYTLYSKLCEGQGYLPLTKRALVVWWWWLFGGSGMCTTVPMWRWENNLVQVVISIHRGPAHVSSLSLVILTLQPRLVSISLSASKC